MEYFSDSVRWWWWGSESWRQTTECVTVTRLILCKSWRNHQSSSTGLLPLLNCNEDLTFNSSAQSFVVRLFFVAREHFVLKCALCVQLSSKWWERSTDRRKLAAKLPAELRALHGAVGAPSDFHLLSSTLSNWYTERERERERRGAEEERPVCIVSTEGGAATGSK